MDQMLLSLSLIEGYRRSLVLTDIRLFNSSARLMVFTLGINKVIAMTDSFLLVVPLYCTP